VSKKGEKRDPNIDNHAVIAYRDKFKLMPNTGRRYDIALTVTDLPLWKAVLNEWGYHKNGKWVKFNPLGIGHMLSEYERREQQRLAEAKFQKWEENGNG
jgi:hypothetical protein